MNNYSKFNTLSTASSFISRSANPSKWSMILGCDGFLWVVTNREASKLMKQGYEMVNF